MVSPIENFPQRPVFRAATPASPFLCHIGQQPLNVSSAYIWGCTFHADLWPAIAKHAKV